MSKKPKGLYHEHYNAAKSDSGWENQFVDQPRQAEEIILAKLADLYSPQDHFRVLDLGCGDGSFARHLANRFPAAEVNAWDPAEDLIKSSSHNPSTKIKWNTFNCFDDSPLLKDYNNYFDCITALATTQVLSGHPKTSEVLAQIELFFNCVSTLLRDKDCFFVNFDGYHDFPEYKLISHHWEIDDEYAADHLAPRVRLGECTYNYPSMAWLERTLRLQGFDNVQITKFNLKDVHLESANEPGSTYTKVNSSGEICSMLNIVEQPWKHVFARR